LTLLKGYTGKPLGNAQGLLESLWAILKGYRKAAGKCPYTRHGPIGLGWIAQWLSAKMWQFPSLFSEAPHFCLRLGKVKEAMEKFKKTLSRSFLFLLFPSALFFAKLKLVRQTL
jgi:hypothetical protein